MIKNQFEKEDIFNFSPEKTASDLMKRPKHRKNKN
jgi:hypothetical protein